MVFMPDFSIDIDAELEVFRKIKGRCFRDYEYQDRWNIVLSYLKQQKLDSLIIYGAERAGSAIPWLTGWPVTAEAVLIVSLDSDAKLFVQYYNHWPQAAATAYGVAVSWAGPETVQSILDRLSKINSRKVGVMGRIGLEMLNTIQNAGFSYLS